MHQYKDRQESPYSSAQLFELVLDIERYPEFLPWCRAARILERGEDRLRAELVISFKHITESYVSEVRFRRPEFVDVKLVQGPFRELHNHWEFRPKGGGTEIALELSFEFRSKLLDMIIGSMFEKASAKMISAFRERADALYRKK